MKRVIYQKIVIKEETSMTTTKRLLLILMVITHGPRPKVTVLIKTFRGINPVVMIAPFLVIIKIIITMHRIVRSKMMLLEIPLYPLRIKLFNKKIFHHLILEIPSNQIVGKHH